MIEKKSTGTARTVGTLRAKPAPIAAPERPSRPWLAQTSAQRAKKATTLSVFPWDEEKIMESGQSQ